MLRGNLLEARGSWALTALWEGWWWWWWWWGFSWVNQGWPFPRDRRPVTTEDAHVWGYYVSTRVHRETGKWEECVGLTLRGVRPPHAGALQVRKENLGSPANTCPDLHAVVCSPSHCCLNLDINELNLPKTCDISFSDPDDLLNFKLVICPDEVGQGYPHDPPKVKCETMVYHPNIDLEGNVCLNILREDWKPVLTINSIIYGLQYLFLEPNPEDPLNKEAAEVLQNNRRLFEQNVQRSMREVRGPSAHARGSWRCACVLPLPSIPGEGGPCDVRSFRPETAAAAEATEPRGCRWWGLQASEGKGRDPEAEAHRALGSGEWPLLGRRSRLGGSVGGAAGLGPRMSRRRPDPAFAIEGPTSACPRSQDRLQPLLPCHLGVPTDVWVPADSTATPSSLLRCESRAAAGGGSPAPGKWLGLTSAPDLLVESYHHGPVVRAPQDA
ncbi:ubiquitin-conjugating enzyme E2M [Cricetulus griseus]